MALSLLSNGAGKLIEAIEPWAVKCWFLKYDLDKLKKSILTIQAVLLDAEGQQGTNHQVKDWLEKLKDAFDDAEDLLDDFSTEDLTREVMTSEGCICFSSANQVVFSFKMAFKIKAIREKFEAINDDRRQFHFTHRTPEPRVEIKRQAHSFVREEDVIGREGEKKILLDLLLNTDMNMKGNVSIISIIGFGGLGKTALAQLVYNDKVVQGHFELKMWVCVSDDFDVEAIAKKIIGSKTDDEMDQVQQKLRKKVERKRYLLVLDDVWNEDRGLWLQLMTLLRDGGKGSKIIITTRSERVSKVTGTSSPFFLKGLDEDQSWKLFNISAFEDGKEPENQNLKAIGKEIVRKCAGVPLAIKSIGSLMYSKESEKEWVHFKDKDLVKIDEQADKVFQLIKLSYDHLPFYLKKCFAFCSLFPKDYRIDKEMLIRLWVAQGFIQSSGESTSFEDVGNEYFMDLAHRSFFQNLERTPLGDIYSCRMHDLVHDLATWVAGNDCIIVNGKEQHIDERTRHVSFGFPLDSSWQVPSSLLRANKLRTFLLPQHKNAEMHYGELSLKESACNLIMSCFEQLRVLDLNHLDSRTLPTCIGMLKHLRYLDLSWNKQIEVLPGSITKLKNLQTLILNGWSSLRELPSDLWKLISLRHLELDYCDKLTCMPRGIGRLTNLQTLTLFVLDTATSRHSGGASELSGLNNLRGTLNIRGLECLRHNTENVEALNLMELSYLEVLKLTWMGQIDADQDSAVAEDDALLGNLQPPLNIEKLYIGGFCGVTISGWVTSITFLNFISIYDCTRLQNLPPLHKLPHLKHLHIWNLSSLEWIDKDGSDDSSSIFFPSLEELSLNYLPNLRGWWRSREEGMLAGRCRQQPFMFESLRELYICDCPNMISMPLYPHVDRVTLDNVCEKILSQAATPLLSNSPLSTLREIHITRINDLKSLSGVLQHLITLHRLNIRDCEELDLCNDKDGSYSMQWKELKNLRSLTLDGITKIVSLPEGLQYVTTIETLRIEDCDNLTHLPEWIASLGSSLQRFEIIKCPKLTSLPDGMRYLSSLQLLRIAECPELVERCERAVGEDWHKISHVPNFQTSWD